MIFSRVALSWTAREFKKDEEVMERAEDLVGQGDLISDFSIWFSFPQGGLPPTIEVRREHLSRKAWEIYTGKPQKE